MIFKWSQYDITSLKLSKFATVRSYMEKYLFRMDL